MTTPLSKMVALLIPSPLTPKRGLGSAGSLSEAKKGVAKVCGDRLSSVGDYSRQRTPRCVFRGRLESPKDLQGLIKLLRYFDETSGFPSQSFPFCTTLKTDILEMRTLEFSLRLFDQTTWFSISEFSVWAIMQKPKLGV